MVSRRWLVATLLCGAALLAAVVALRDVAGVSTAPRHTEAPARSVAAFAAPGVEVDQGGRRPGTPTGPRFVLTGATPVLRWSAVPGAAGYDVRWRAGGHDEQQRLTTAPAVALTGVPIRSSVSVWLAAIDRLGRRSPPLRLASGPLHQDRATGPATGFVDPFSSAAAPDRSRWRIPEAGQDCVFRGRDTDRGMLVLGHACELVQLRPSVPLLLGPAGPDGGLGRLVVATDAPGPDGELVLAALPGAHAALPPGVLDRAGPAAGSVAPDPTLPVGALLLRVSVDGPALSVGAAETTLIRSTGRSVAYQPGVPRTWELRVATDAVAVVVDGEEILRARVTVPWRTATAVIAVRSAATGGGPPGRTLLDEIRMTAPSVRTEPVRVYGLPDVADGATQRVLRELDVSELRNAQSVRLLGWLTGPGTATVALGDGPPVPLEAPAPGARPPTGAGVTADLPIPDDPGAASTVKVLLAAPPGTLLRNAVLEVVNRPDVAITAPAPRVPLESPRPQAVPTPRLRLTTADGTTVDAARPIRTDRLTLHVTVDPPATQVPTGYVGLRVRLADRRVLGLPTDRDGPAAAGSYRIRLDLSRLSAAAELPLWVQVIPASAAVPPSVAMVTMRRP